MRFMIRLNTVISKGQKYKGEQIMNFQILVKLFNSKITTYA
jgi:hypothetical protein